MTWHCKLSSLNCRQFLCSARRELISRITAKAKPSLMKHFDFFGINIQSEPYSRLAPHNQVSQFGHKVGDLRVIKILEKMISPIKFHHILQSRRNGASEHHKNSIDNRILRYRTPYTVPTKYCGIYEWPHIAVVFYCCALSGAVLVFSVYSLKKRPKFFYSIFKFLPLATHFPPFHMQTMRPSRDLTWFHSPFGTTSTGHVCT